MLLDNASCHLPDDFILQLPHHRLPHLAYRIHLPKPEMATLRASNHHFDLEIRSIS